MAFIIYWPGTVIIGSVLLFFLHLRRGSLKTDNLKYTASIPKDQKRRIIIGSAITLSIIGLLTFLIKLYPSQVPELIGRWDFNLEATMKYKKNSFVKKGALKGFFGEDYRGRMVFKRDGEVIMGNGNPSQWSFYCNIISKKGNVIEINIDNYAPEIKMLGIDYKTETAISNSKHKVIINPNQIAFKAGVWWILDKESEIIFCYVP